MAPLAPALAAFCVAGLLMAGPALAAGNVEVEVKGGNLVITGDDADNKVLITSPGGYQVAPDDGTTNVNGSPVPKTFPDATKGVLAKLGDGNDTVRALNATIAGNLSIDGGDGTDGITLSGSLVEGNVQFKAGNGPANTMLEAGSVVEGNLSVKAGDGVDFVYTEGGSGVMGKASFKFGNGANALDLNASLFEKGLKIAAKEGSDFISLDGVVAAGVDLKLGDGGSTVELVNLSTVDGNLRVRSRDGIGSLAIDTSNIAGNLQVKDKSGDCTAQLTSATILGNLQLKCGDGFDSQTFNGPAMAVSGKVRIENGPGGSSFSALRTLFQKDLKVATKDGFAMTRLTGSAVQGNLSVDAGREGGQLDLEFDAGQVNLVEKNLSFRVKDGLLTADFERLLVQGKTSITGGGKDFQQVYVDDAVLQGSLAIKLGGGVDVVVIEQNGDAGGTHSQIVGKATIATGAGDDIIAIGKAGEPGNSTLFQGSLKIDGGKGSDTFNHLGHGNVYEKDVQVKNVEQEL